MRTIHRRFLALSALILASLLPVAALAQNAAPAATASDSPQGIVATITSILLPLLSALGAYFVKRLIDAIEAKTGVQLSKDNYDKLMEQVDLSIHFAAEQTAKKVGDKVESNAKLKLATDYVNGAITHFGLDKVAEDRLQQLIEAKLNAKKSEGAKV